MRGSEFNGIGRLGHNRMVVQEKTLVKDEGIGDFKEVWTDVLLSNGDVLEISVEIVDSGSREYFQAQRHNSEMTDLFRTRYRSDLNSAENRLKKVISLSPLEFRAFDIFPTRPDNKRRWMLVEARETNQS